MSRLVTPSPLLGVVPDVIVEIDAMGVLGWVSPSVEAMTGLGPEQLVGRPLLELVRPDDLGEAARADAQVRRGDLAGYRARLLGIDGRSTHVWVRVAPLLDQHGGYGASVACIRDIEDLVAAEAAAEAERRRFRATLDTLFDPHVVLDAVRDADGEIVDFVHVEANSAACHYNGLPREELIGLTLREVAGDEFAAPLVEMYRTVVTTGVPLLLDDFPFPDRSMHGRERRFDVRAVKVGDSVSHTWRDVTERHETAEHLARQATHDALTGLPNRVAALDEITRASSAGRRSGRVVGVMMLDVDHFKSCNDTMGHAVGDQLLKQVANRLTASVREADLVGRLGGDEFVVVMRDLEDAAEAFTAADRIVEAFHAPLVAAGHDLSVTISGGVTFSRLGATADELLEEADAALYRAKEQGRDRIAAFDDDLRLAAHHRVVMAGQLRPALALGELTLHYQPEIEIATGAVVAVEALLRWRHPSGELYAAAQFIDLAEQIGLMVDVGRWVCTRACRDASRWGRPGDEPTIVVNLSLAQLTDGSFAAQLIAAAAAAEVPMTRMGVEIGEDAVLRAGSAAVEGLRALRTVGARVTLDRFGVGSASLSAIRDGLVDGVKIDRSLVAPIGSDDRAKALVAGITAFARRLGVQVCADGVETPAQLEVLRAVGCHRVQGYLLSPPVPAREIPRLLRRDDRDRGHLLI